MHKALEQEIHETLDSLEPHLLNRSIEKMKDALALQASRTFNMYVYRLIIFVIFFFSGA